MPLYFYEADPMDIFSQLHSPCQARKSCHSQKSQENKPWSVEVDTTGYLPDELKLKLEGQDLILSAEQEVKTEATSFNRSFTRKWRLPKNLELSEMETKLEEGKLKISAPRKPNSVEFPINFVQKKPEEEMMGEEDLD